MTLQETVSALLKKQVSEAEAMQFASHQFGILAAFLQDKVLEEKFLNGFTSWYEVFFDLTALVEEAINDDRLIADSEMRAMVKEWTDQFEQTYKDVDWGEDKMYDDELGLFFNHILKTHGTGN